MPKNHVYDTPLVTDHLPTDLGVYGYVSNDTVATAMGDIVANLDGLDSGAPVPGLTKSQVLDLVGLLNRIELGIAKEWGWV